MKRNAVIILALGWSAAAFAQPIITPTNFLGTNEPERMCQKYIREVYSEQTSAFAQPLGGAFIRIEGLEFDTYHYIFCDVAYNELAIFTLWESGGVRNAVDVKRYGLRVEPFHFAFDDTIAPGIIYLSYAGCDTVGRLSQPVDVAVTSTGRYFKPESDRIYVLDQGNRRVVKLRYDPELDSLIWESSFGPGTLHYPTALDYADYGDENPDNDDIYVTDGGAFKLFRFSASGTLEASYGGWGSDLGAISYPTGVAVSTSEEYPNRVYVTDSHNHRVVRYYSETSGDIIAERQFIFPLTPLPLISSIDIDVQGNLYILDSYNHNITVISPNLDKVLLVYGSQGYEPGQFDYPEDIYIDGNEMQVCEHWADSAGIQSFNISQGLAKPGIEPLPMKFALYQNYPNPFNSTTLMKFDLPERANVELVIFNILGQRIISLVSRQLPAGHHAVVWNGRNQDGRTVASGVYFTRIVAGEKVAVKKMLLLK